MGSSLSAALLATTVSAAEKPVLWAWERPEDVRFASRDAEVAVQTGFVVLTGAGVFTRGRRFPALTSSPPEIAMVHVQIDHHRPLAWTADQRRQTAQVILERARPAKARRLQVDFEVRRSERAILLDVLSDLRRLMGPDQALSMTALASWCDTETWLDRAPVEEIVPMLFRMGTGGLALKARLEAGGDFANPRCRTALGVSLDAPLARIPAHRRIYLFSPRSWTAKDFGVMRQRIERWSASG